MDGKEASTNAYQVIDKLRDLHPAVLDLILQNLELSEEDLAATMDALESMSGAHL